MLPLLRKLTGHTIPMIRKKSILVILSIYQIEHSYVPDMKQITCDTLRSSEPLLMLTAVSMLNTLLPADPSQYKDITKRLADILDSIVKSTFPK